MLGSDGDLEVRDAEGRLLLLAKDLERIEVAPRDAVAEAPYLVQLASLSTREAAEKATSRAARVTGHASSVVPDPDTGRYAVRVGPIATREEVDAVRLQARSDFADAFVVPGPIGRAAKGALAIRAGARPEAAWPREVVVRSPSGRPIAVLGQEYEGDLEVFVNRRAALTVVNELPLDSYLLGVVPNELGPDQFPRLEALMAQAVAARTYALRNLGQYGASGFDLCATPRCQVYKGVETHHALSDEAVKKTRGLVATYQGEPIRALFTSTCGGRTERVEEIFRGDPAPYLSSVYCAENDGAAPATVPRSERFFSEDGDLVNEEVVLAHVLGLPVAWPPVRAWLERKLSPAELSDWIGRARDLLGREGRDRSAAGTVTRQRIVEAIVEGLGLEERIAFNASDGPDSDLLAIAPDRALLGRSEAWAFLLDVHAIAPFPDGSLRPDQHPSRAAALRALSRVLSTLGLPRLSKGVYRSFGDGALTFEGAGEVSRVRLAPGAALFRDVRGEAMPCSELPLRGGDSLVLHRSGAGIDYLKGIDLGKGDRYDRFSKYESWEVTLDSDELEGRLKGRARGVRDLEIVRRTPTGRVADLLVKADSGDLHLEGLDIRFTLGLRENLFTVERERAASGATRSYRFVGRGFGHGVGLCQVGAYGMALSGASYDAILAHYYPGVTLEKRY